MQKPTPRKAKKIIQNNKKKTNLVVFFQIITGMFLSILSLILFITITYNVMEKELVSLDVSLSHFIYSLRTPVLTPIMYFLSFLGGWFIFFATVIFALFLLLKQQTGKTILFLLTIYTGTLMNIYIKDLLKIPRPDLDPIYLETFFSFPSGHAMNSFIFYTIIVYILYRLTHNRSLIFLLTPCALILILLIGLSRVYLGVHYPSDIIAGYVAGFWWVTTIIFLDKTRLIYRLRKRK